MRILAPLRMKLHQCPPTLQESRTRQIRISIQNHSDAWSWLWHCALPDLVRCAGSLALRLLVVRFLAEFSSVAATVQRTLEKKCHTQ